MEVSGLGLKETLRWIALWGKRFIKRVSYGMGRPAVALQGIAGKFRPTWQELGLASYWVQRNSVGSM